MELADYMRNKSYDINCRKLFDYDQNGFSSLDLCGQLFSQIISHMEKLLLSYNKLNVNAVELKKMGENFVYAQKIIDRNIWDRTVTPDFERNDYKKTEDSINQVKLKKKQAFKEILNKLKLFFNNFRIKQFLSNKKKL